MLYLEGSGLRVAILDPEADRARLGSRQCAGGYIWQVTDEDKGELLSGPEFPDADPKPFSGQGLPEIFETALGQDRARVGEEVHVIGVGRVKRDSPIQPFHVRDNFRVSEFAAWEVRADPRAARMRSRQAFAEYELELERKVALQGRALESSTAVANLGAAPLPLRWFAHPFFPAAEKCFRFSLEFSLPDNPAYRVDGEGFIERKPGFAWARGQFLPLTLPWGYPLSAEVAHPLLGSIQVECRFPLAWMPIWCNDRTNSFEPYFHTVLAPGSRAEWGMVYRF